MAAVPDESRLRALLAATVGLTAELSLDALLQRLVEISAELTGAQYAALGVIDEDGRSLERFVTTGVDEQTFEAIGELPRGRGILGVLIRDAQSLRLDDIGSDARSVGFPPNHPPMRTFLGVPIILRGVSYGNLYLTEKEGGESFTEQDEEIVTLLAAHAAVAIENARLFESAMRWSRQLETLHEIVRSMVEESELDRMLDLICRRLRELIGARLAVIVLPVGDHELRIAAADGEGDGARGAVGRRFKREGSKSARVLARQQSARVDSVMDDPEMDPDESRFLGIRTALVVPLVARGRSIGVITVNDKLGGDPRFTEADLRLTEIFAARAAVAVDLSARVERDVVRRVVAAQEQERTRLSRELHDETGQALTSILLGLRTIRSARDPASAERAENELRELVVAALQDVRALAVELRPSSLDDFGLMPALERLAETLTEASGIDVSVESSLPDKRLPPDAETVLYRFVQEALTNVAKHARATTATIVVAARDGGVSAVVEDDGHGFDERDIRSEALGIVGMRERLALLGGTLAIESSANGTSMIAFVPLS